MKLKYILEVIELNDIGYLGISQRTLENTKLSVVSLA
jgi:hypothetical protein